MRAGVTISTAGHVVVLALAVTWFSAKPFEAAPVDSLPVDIISVTEFSQLAVGAKNAAKSAAPKPVVDRIGEQKPAKDSTAKVVDKPEIQTASADATPPPPESKPLTPELKAEPKQVPELKTEPMAEAAKHDLNKPDAKPPTPPKRPPQPKLDISKIENRLALLDKREAQRQAATGTALNATPSLGVATANALTLTQNEIDALRARLRECWDVPVGVIDARDLVVVVQLQFRRDGSLSTEPVVLNTSSHPAFQVAAESALRAIRKCAPYTFLPIAKYEAWKDIEVKFDPRDMFRG